jgi:hypothetical protein
MATPLPLEGDGLVDNLFYFLWSKDDFGGGPRVFVPHTVIFKLSQPSAWYFTSLRSSKIKKKSRANLTNAQIEHEFTKKKSPTDIVAVYIYQPDAVASTGTLGASAMSTAEPARTTIEYFDAAALREFLYKRDKPHGGMLQKFILPKGARNATVRAIWSPKICLLERAVNRRNVYDKRFGVYERGVTFDGPADAYSAPEPVRGAALPGEVQMLCEAVVDHVTRVTYHKYRISRMVMHLKTDADDRLWLLWCSSLRLLNPGAGHGGPLSLSTTEVPAGVWPLDIVGEAHVPEFAPFGRQTSGGSAFAAGSAAGTVVGRQRAGALAISSHIGAEHSDHALLFGQARCASCGGLVDRRKLLATTYKAIIEHFTRFLKFLRIAVNDREGVAIAWPPENKYIEAAGGIGFGILPFLSSDSGGGSPHGRRMLSNTGTSDPSGSAFQSRTEFIIPPVIRFLHPSFSTPDFERHRRDPIFLHKQAAVCEACCLVYADYSTSALEANSIRQSAPALLRPHSEIPELRRRLDPLDPLATALSASPTRPASSSSPPYAGSKQKDKPPASAWKPLTSTVSESTLGTSSSVRKPLRSVKKARNPTRMLRFPSAPELPERIDSFEELRDADCDPQDQSSNNHVAEREERFFRELYNQKKLEKGHPLRHMVDSAARLGDASLKKPGKKLQRLAALGGGGYSATLMGSTASTGALADAVAETEQFAKAQQWKSPYSIVQRLREPSDDADSSVDGGNGGMPGALGGAKSPGKTPGKKSVKKKKKKVKGGDKVTDKPSEVSGKTRAAKFVSSREKQAADEHRDFLFAALSEAKGQVRDRVCREVALVMSRSSNVCSLSRQLEHIESLATIIPVEGESDESDEDDEDCYRSTEHCMNRTDQANDEEHHGSNDATSDQDEDDESAEEEDQRQNSDEAVRAAEDHDGDDNHEEYAVEESSDVPAEQHDVFESEPEHCDQVDAELAVELVDPPPVNGKLGEFSSDWRLAAAVPLPPSDGQSSSSLSISFPDELHSDPPHPDDFSDDEDDEDEMY